MPSSKDKIGDLEYYKLQWKLTTEGDDGHLGGLDFARTVIEGTLHFCKGGNFEEEDYVDVGRIKLVKFHERWIRNNLGGRRFDLYDETQEDLELETDVLRRIRGDPSDDDDDDYSDDDDDDEDNDSLIDEGLGDVIHVKHIVVDKVHRGYGLSLWMLDAADAVFGSQDSIMVLIPFPLQFEGGDEEPHYGFPAPPPSGFGRLGEGVIDKKKKLVFEKRLEKKRLKIARYWENIGFRWFGKKKGRYMVRRSNRYRKSLKKVMKEYKKSR